MTTPTPIPDAVADFKARQFPRPCVTRFWPAPTRSAI